MLYQGLPIVRHANSEVHPHQLYLLHLLAPSTDSGAFVFWRKCLPHYAGTWFYFWLSSRYAVRGERAGNSGVNSVWFFLCYEKMAESFIIEIVNCEFASHCVPNNSFFKFLF